MQIISRAQWGARPPRSVYTTTWAKRLYVVYHHVGSGTARTTVQSIQDHCMDTKRHSDIDYNVLVRNDDTGAIYEGRQGIWLTVGSHCLNFNTASIGVCFITAPGAPLTEAAKRSARWIFDEANRLKRAAGTGSLTAKVHSDLVQTSCPQSVIASWVRAGMPATAPAEGKSMYGTVTKGAKGDAARWVQKRCRRIDPTSLPRYGVDNDYGGETADWVARLFGGDGGAFGPDQDDVYEAKKADLERQTTIAAVLAQVPKAELPGRLTVSGTLDVAPSPA